MRRVVVNSVGQQVRTLDNIDAIPGKPIQLTIDLDLQTIAESDMADKEGAVVAMDARTGEILAMVSRPTFDPNDFAVRIPAADWEKLNSDPAHAALESHDPGPTRSRLRFQNRHGHGHARIKGHS